MYKNYQMCVSISSQMCEKITEYYVKLHKENKSQTVLEISRTLGINLNTLKRYFNLIDLNVELRELNSVQKLILMHTKFCSYNKYSKLKAEYDRQLQKEKIINTINKRKQQKELLEKRKQLIYTLKQVSKTK